MKLAEITKNSLWTVEPTDTLDQAMYLMADNRIHHLPVVEDRKLVGILSDRDLLAVFGKSPDEIPTYFTGPAKSNSSLVVADVMTTDVKTMTPSDTIKDAGKLMIDKRIHSIPLILGERVTGIITETDLLNLFVDNATRYIGHKVLDPNAKWRRQPVAMFMRRRNLVATKSSETPLAAFHKMRAHNVRHLLVLHHGKIVGLVSDSDIRRVLQTDKPRADNAPEASTVAKIMTRNLKTVELSASLEDAARHMLKDSIGALPVLGQEKLVGLVTETDLLRALVTAWR